MKDSVHLTWKEGLAFEAKVDGFSLTIDATKEHGGSGSGPRPKPLMMVALAGCTGMDVVSILKKMRVEFSNLSVHVKGELTEEHPKYFTAMHIIYEFTGINLSLDKLQKAVELSQERYCGVGVSYRKAMQVTYEITINESR